MSFILFPTPYPSQLTPYSLSFTPLSLILYPYLSPILLTPYPLSLIPHSLLLTPSPYPPTLPHPTYALPPTPHPLLLTPLIEVFFSLFSKQFQDHIYESVIDGDNDDDDASNRLNDAVSNCH